MANVPLKPPVCFCRGEIKWNHNYSSLLLFTGFLHREKAPLPGRTDSLVPNAEGDAWCVAYKLEQATFYSSEEAAAPIIILKVHFEPVHRLQ